ncbi:hypothetical protein HK102_011590, partial [Quaeritorhiza haematococci]
SPNDIPIRYRKKVWEMLKFVGRHPELVEEIKAVGDSIQQWSVQDSELAIILEHDAKPVVYIRQVGPGIYKYSKTNRLERRVVEPKRNHIQDNNNFRLVFAVETPHNELPQVLDLDWWRGQRQKHSDRPDARDTRRVCN